LAPRPAPVETCDAGVEVLRSQVEEDRGLEHLFAHPEAGSPVRLPLVTVNYAVRLGDEHHHELFVAEYLRDSLEHQIRVDGPAAPPLACGIQLGDREMQVRRVRRRVA